MLVLLLNVVDCAKRDITIDGVIKVKLSNFTGYDLWFPDGKMRYSRELFSRYICNDMWYSVPEKPTDVQFDVAGFFIVVFLALCVTLVVTAMLPMMVSISKQNKLSIIKGSLNALFANFNARMWANADHSRNGVDRTTEVSRMKEEGEAEQARIEARQRRQQKFGLFAFIWMYVCTVLTFLVAVVVMDAVMVLNGWPNSQSTKPHGYCYSLDKSNMFYDEDDRRYMDSVEGSQHGAKLLTAGEDDNATDYNTTLDDYARATVSAIDKDTATFTARCGKKFFRPSESSNTSYQFVPRYETVCKPVKMRHPVDVRSTVWKGGVPNAAEAKLGKDWFMYDMENARSRNKVRSGGVSCEYYFIEDENIYNAKFVSCCAPYDAVNGIDNFCHGNWTSADLKDSNIHDADTTTFLRNKNAMASFAVKTWEVQVDEYDNWYECRVQDNIKPRVMRDGVEMPDSTIKVYRATNDDAARFPFGWEQTDDGSEYIMNNQFLVFSHGLGYSLFWGNETNEEWLRKHLDRDVTHGWRSPKATMGEFLPLDTQPPVFADCEMTFVLDRSYADLEELNSFCSDVSAKVNQNGLLVFTTSSEDVCGLIVNVSVQGVYVSSFIELDAMHSYRLFADGDLYWRCATDTLNMSEGSKCDYNARWNEFRPENYSTKYVTENNSPIYPATGGNDANPSPNPFRNLKNIVKYVAAGVGAITGTAAVIAIGIKVAAALKVSKSMMGGGLFGKGRRTTNNNNTYNSSTTNVVVVSKNSSRHPKHRRRKKKDDLSCSSEDEDDDKIENI